MLTWASILLQALKAWNGLLALFSIKREREAARKEVILDVKENSDAAMQEADAARASQRERDLAGGLRDDDGYRRD